MKVSMMSDAVSPSLTRKLFNKALEIGSDVINLTLGDPDILTPINIRKAACEAIMAGKTRYSANAGLDNARKAYGEYFKKQYGIPINPLENVIITVGGMEGLFLSIAATINSGDEVILLAPYYVNYLQMIKMCQGKAVIIDRLGKDTETILNEIKERISGRTTAMIVNSPSNPGGDMLPYDLLTGIANIAIDNDLLIISDDVYSSLIYDNRQFDSIVMREGMSERTILIDSCSKRFAMTGWRIGFVVGPKNIIANMTKMQENIAACAPLPAQYAAIEAYKGDFDYSYIQKEYEHRRDLVYNRLLNIPLLKPIFPEATFYCFINISQTGLSSEEFAYQLLEKQHVAVVPGISYGDNYNSYIRLAFTLKDELLNLAMDRLSDFCNSLK